MLSRSRKVTAAVAAGSARANCGRAATTGVSHSRRPSSTRVATSSAVMDLGTEPMMKRVSGPTGRPPPPSSVTPKPRAKRTSPPCTTATAAPGTPKRSSAPST